ncbi:MAG TPA: cytochrome c biogenesis protein CcdA [Nitrososphaeraceae archaeon]|jgi:cytochrome c-type biogenesis protein|nr:cytochrome c biogenesis protein CcdA [Nitrososphaeraceae archaeon]
MAEINIIVSAIAGMGSFFSPCILPILPAFISYLSGTTLHEVSNINKTQTSIENRNIESNISTSNNRNNKKSIFLQKSTRLNIFLNTVYFVLGFSLVFAVLGVALNSVLVNIGNSFQNTLQIIGGIVIISFGVFLILSSKLNNLNFEKKLTRIPKFKTSYITSFVFGIAFAAGWTPCVGPILGSTFTLAATSPGEAYNLLLAYSLGLGTPFLITAAFFSRATGLLKKMVKYLKYFNPVMGSFLIILGILIFTNQLNVLGNFPLVNEIINLERGGL